MNNQKGQKIAVIGTGVIGLTTALLLARKGYEVVAYSNEVKRKVVSKVACAIWLPMSVSFEDESLYWNMAKYSWDEFKTRLGDEFGVYWKFHIEMLLENEEIPIFANIVKDFKVQEDRGLPSDFNYYWSCKTLIIEMQKYLPTLKQKYEEIGRIKELDFQSLQDIFNLNEDIIFNCSGLGSRHLFSDNSLEPVKGQLVLHEQSEFDSSVGAGDYCIIPRSDYCILGSLFKYKFDSEVPNDSDTWDIWNTVQDWDNNKVLGTNSQQLGLDSKRIKEVITGLRPFRSNGIRLEKEYLRNKTIIHNYGHGGGGVSLSWGTCKHAIELFERG